MGDRMSTAKILISVPVWKKGFNSPVIVDEWLRCLALPFYFAIKQVLYVPDADRFEVTIESDVIPAYAGNQAEVIPLYHTVGHKQELYQVLFRNTPESEEERLYPESTDEVRKAKALLYEEMQGCFTGSCFRPQSLSNAIDAFVAVVQCETLNKYTEQRDKK